MMERITVGGDYVKCVFVYEATRSIAKYWDIWTKKVPCYIAHTFVMGSPVFAYCDANITLVAMP